MTRKRLSITAAVPLEEENAALSQPPDVAAPQGGNPATLRDKLARKSISHSSFYASPRVLKALREIALARDCKVNDLVCEGLRVILARDGRDFDALNRDS